MNSCSDKKAVRRSGFFIAVWLFYCLFSLTVGISNMPVSGSLSAGAGNTQSDYRNVKEQSGLKAGNNGFQINVTGNTSLIGAVITSTDNAAPGLGNASGNSSSVTQSGISGIAGNKDARTGDKATGIQQIFDASVVSKEVNAQVQITSEFGKLSPKFVANFAGNKAATLNALAESESDPQKKAELEAQAKQWGEGGAYRIVLHTATGAAAGGISGAAGAATSASSAEFMNELQNGIQTNLQKAGLNEETAKLTAQGVSDLAAAGMGLLVGGTQGAATALATDANNRQLHKDVNPRKDERKLIQSDVAPAYAGCASWHDNRSGDRYSCWTIVTAD
ncbi:hypothetical protein ACO0LB_19640 [Undibacterium sp. SXout7W]|uniref:hypothetical protein n=1 Tax=Undibacterium sp. SXout7W TaxID=3413049 RepID=UPI003BF1A630